MNKLNEYLAGKNLYNLFLHLALIACLVVIAVLAKQNSDLKNGASRPPQESIKEGQYLSLADLTPATGNATGDSVAHRKVVFVFTTSCPFCKETLPMWKSIADSAKKDDKLAVVGICLGSPEEAKVYVAQQHISFPVFTPKNKESFSNANKLHSVPQTLVRTKEGSVEKVWKGRLTAENYSEVVRTISQIHN